MKIKELLGIEHPLIQAPMAGVDSVALAAAVCGAGGLGSLACALLTPLQVKMAFHAIKALADRPVNLNFFCHTMPQLDHDKAARWRARLEGYYRALAVDPDVIPAAPLRLPFEAAMVDMVAALRPEIVSFHFGLPDAPLLRSVKASGAKILATATTVAEAVWLAARDCDAIIAQGSEAGGHRGMFLTDDLTTQSPTRLLVPAIAAAVPVPVIAVGGIADARAIRELMQSGAAAIQLGTAYLFCPESQVSPLYLARLTAKEPGETALTNIYTGRPARGIMTRLMHEMGPLSDAVPPFPFAASYVAPLRQKAETQQSSDFSQLWAGSNYHAGRIMPARDLTLKLAAEARI